MHLTPRLRPRSTGPALRSAPLPVTATVLSALTHGLLAVVMIVAASTWSVRQPKAYVVNLVPAVAATGGAGAAGIAAHGPRAARARDPESRARAAARLAGTRTEPAGPRRQLAGPEPARSRAAPAG